MELLNHINFQIWIILTISMMITALLLPGLSVSGPIGAFIAVAGLAFVNAHFWDAALFFSIPDTFSLHIIILFFANGIIFWILVKILPGIEVRGCLSAFLAPIIFTIISAVLNNYAKNIDWSKALRSGLSYVETVRDQLKSGQPPVASTPKPHGTHE